MISSLSVWSCKMSLLHFDLFLLFFWSGVVYDSLDYFFGSVGISCISQKFLQLSVL